MLGYELFDYLNCAKITLTAKVRSINIKKINLNCAKKSTKLILLSTINMEYK